MEIPKNSNLLYYDQLAKLADGLPLDLIITSRSCLTTISSNCTANDAMKKMDNKFDQLPIIDNQKFMGMIFRNDILNSADQGLPIKKIFRSSSKIETIHANQSVKEAIKYLCDNEICIVFDTSLGDFCGLLHYADLNKQAVKIYCYLWTSALEMSLAALLRSHLPNHIEWISALSDQRKNRVLERVEISRRQNIELSPIEGLELSDLINIWAKRKELLKFFEVSKSEFKRRANHLVALRHASMHPVRTLIKHHSDVKTLKRQVDDLHFLVQSTTSAMIPSINSKAK